MLVKRSSVAILIALSSAAATAAHAQNAPAAAAGEEVQEVTVTGPRGTLRHMVADPIRVSREDGTVQVSRPDDERLLKSLHGLSRTLIANMVTGVTAGYTKTLEIVGTASGEA